MNCVLQMIMYPIALAMSSLSFTYHTLYYIHHYFHNFFTYQLLPLISFRIV